METPRPVLVRADLQVQL